MKKCPKCGKSLPNTYCPSCNIEFGETINETTAKISKEEIQTLIEKAKHIPVTTCDINIPYTIIAPIIYNTSNRGLFSSLYKKLQSKYIDPIYSQLLVMPELSPMQGFDGITLLTLLDANPLNFETNVGQKEFDMAYYMCIAELKLRAMQLGGNAVVGMKMDIDLDTTNWGSFYIQMYGTVVKCIE